MPLYFLCLCVFYVIVFDNQDDDKKRNRRPDCQVYIKATISSSYVIVCYLTFVIHILLYTDFSFHTFIFKHYRLVRSAPAIPLKSPFEDFLNRDHPFTSESNGPVQLAVDKGRVEKAANAVEDTVVNKDAMLNEDEEILIALPTSSSKPTECMGMSEYQQLYNKMVVW